MKLTQQLAPFQLAPVLLAAIAAVAPASPAQSPIPASRPPAIAAPVPAAPAGVIPPDLATAPVMPGSDSSEASAPMDSGPSLFTALQEQLGLRLEPGKGPVGRLVIDHIEHPTEN
jgi:hypothetical protein